MTGGNKPGTDISDGHIRLALTIIALIVIHIRGGRGGAALGRAYVATFWWGDYISP